MKRLVLAAGLAIALAPFTVAQDASSPQTDQTPSGTQAVGEHQDKIVRPEKKHVKVDKGTVEAAQKALAGKGYEPGPADGIAGPKTSAAVSKFQSDQGLTQTGHLDQDTLSKLNVGGAATLSAAPGDVGRGGKSFGQNVKEGHPVEAGKALGQGVGNSAKKVGQGTKSVAKEGADKVGGGVSAIGNKVKGDSDKGESNSNDQNQDQNAPQDQQNPK